MVLTLAGGWTWPPLPSFSGPSSSSLTSTPPAIVCDLTQVEAIDPLRAGVFPRSRISPSAGQPRPWCCVPAVAGRRQPPPPEGGALSGDVSRAWTRRWPMPAPDPPRLLERLMLGPLRAAARAGQGPRRRCVAVGTGGPGRVGRTVASSLATTPCPCRHSAGAAEIAAAGGDAGSWSGACWPCQQVAAWRRRPPGAYRSGRGPAGIDSCRQRPG